MRLLPKSPRRRRRLGRAGLVVLAALVVGLMIAVFKAPEDDEPRSATPRRGQILRPERPVPVTPEMRRDINATLDRFVPAAVLRRDPLAAYELATPSLRAVATRRQWARGEIPVFPFEARGSRFHGWTLNWSIRNNVNVDLLLQAPPDKGTVTGIAYTVDFKRIGGRWLVDSFFPTAEFRRVAAPNGSRIVAQPDLAPQQSQGSPQDGRTRVDRALAFVPFAVVGLGIGLVLSIFLIQAVRARRAARAYAANRY